MSLTHSVSFLGKMATLWVAMVIAVLCTALGALFFLTAALLIWLDHYVGPAAAAAIAGLMLALEAVLIFVGCHVALKRMRARQPSLGGNALGLIAPVLRLMSLVVRGSPRKALLMAVILGALADYFTSSRSSKD